MAPPNRDTTSTMIERLKLDRPLDAKIVEKTQNSLRLLKLKNPIGSFGKHDNEMKRSCALLEYIAREESGYKIPLDRLARAACMKSKDFVLFHEMIGNFKENATSSRSVSSSRSATFGTKSSSGTNKGPDTIVLAKSSIPSLAMQLGVFLPNTNSVAVEAQRLFQDMLSHLQSKKARERISGLQDIRRYQSTYEAVCFYLIATKEHQTNACPPTTGTNGGSRLSQHRNSASKDSDDFDKRLDLSTFLDVAKDFTRAQFQMVLDYVSELRQEMKHTTLPKGIDNANGPRRALDVNRKTIGDAHMAQTSRKRPRTGTVSEQENISTGIEATDQVMVLIEQQDSVDVSNTYDTLNDTQFGSLKESRNYYSPSFVEWKTKTVASACETAQGMMQRDGIDVENEILHQQDAILDYATQEVLIRHKLVP